MSRHENYLYESILYDHFGSHGACAGKCLASCGRIPFGILLKNVPLLPGKLKKILAVLVEHNVVDYLLDDRGMVEYAINSGAILGLHRSPRFIHIAKTLHGDSAELLVEELLHHGQVTMAAAVTQVQTRLNEALEGEGSVSVGDIETVFGQLVRAHYIQRCPMLDEDASSGTDAVIPEFIPTRHGEEFRMVNERSTGAAASQNGEPPAKKQAVDTISAADKVFWKVNLTKFSQFIRDQLITKMVANIYDPTAGEVMQALLKVCEMGGDYKLPHSQLLPVNEIFKRLPERLEMSRAILDQYLFLLTDDSRRFLVKSGDSAGGSYQIDFASAFKALSQSIIESIIHEKFGIWGLRFFRLLLEKKYLEQNEIESFALLPPKEAREVLYGMLFENFVCSKEVCKQTDFAPSACFYLFHVDFDRTARHSLQLCYRTLGNLIRRRQFQTNENSQLLEDEQKVEALISRIVDDDRLDEDTKKQQVADIEESYMPPAKKEQVEIYKKHFSKLVKSETMVDESIFILRRYLAYVSEIVD